MKNLRKVLALVLAVAALLSFTAMASAADFSDEAAISNDEAVSVLAGLTVIKGYEDGSYLPEKAVTRAEMAKMISVILNSGADINELYEDACTFTDMADASWAKGYVAYCASKGIIAGRDDKTFDPMSNVTGTEAAKMAICALGYSAKNEGLEGDVWAANTLSLASDLKLFAGVATKPGEALTREGAAQLLLNALETQVVKYTGATTVEVAGVTVVTGGSLAYVANTDSDYAAAAADGKMQMIEKYFPLAKKEAGYVDEYGRPGVQWTDAAGKTLDAVIDEPVYKMQGTIKAKDIRAAVGKDGKDIKNISVYVESGLMVEGNSNSIGKTAYPGVTEMTEKSTASWGGRSIEHEVYYNAETDTLIYLCMAWRNSVIDNINEDDLTYDLYNVGSDGYTKSGSALATGLKFEEGEWTEDDNGTLVLRMNNLAGKRTIKTITSTKVVTSKGGTTANSGNFIKISTDAGSYQPTNFGTIKTFTVGEKYTLYIDEFGYVVTAKPYVAEVEDEEVSYLYVLASDTDEGTFGADTHLAQVLNADGVVEVVETDILYAPEALYSIKEVKNDVYKLDLVDDAAEDVTITKATAAVDSYYANNKTVFVVETTVDGEAQYDVYTGIKNVPSIDVAKMYVVADGSKLELVFCLDSTPVNAPAGATQLDISVLWVVKTLGSVVAEDAEGKGYEYKELAAIINGQPTTVKVLPSVHTALKGTADQAVLIDSYKLDDNGVITEVNKVTADDASGFDTMTDGLYAATINEKYADGVIKVNSKNLFVEEDVVGYIYNSKSKAMEEVSVTKLTKTFAGWVLVEDGEIAAFYGTDKF